MSKHQLLQQLLQHIIQYNPQNRSYTLDNSMKEQPLIFYHKDCHNLHVWSYMLLLLFTMGCMRGIQKWFGLICRNCIIFSLNTKQMLAQNTPILDCTSLPSLWELLDGFTEPFLMDARQPPVQSHCLCRRSALS